MHGDTRRYRVLVGAVEEPHALVARLGLGVRVVVGVGVGLAVALGLGIRVGLGLRATLKVLRFGFGLGVGVGVRVRVSAPPQQPGSSAPRALARCACLGLVANARAGWG